MKNETYQRTRTARLSTTILVIAVVVTLIGGGLLGYSVGNSVFSEKIGDLQNQVSTLQAQLSSVQSTQNVVNQNNTYFLDGNVSLSMLYEQIKDSVVLIRGVIVQYDIFHHAYYSQVQGSGFVYTHTGQAVVITNYHVVEDAINITVTFIDGNGYAATLLGADAYADLAVLSIDTQQASLTPLEIVDLSSLEVGDPVIAVGNPYGLAGSMTTGIVSALGRTITEDMSGSYPIANVIQTNAAINPGNSGGPLLNYQGQVIGITTAIVSDSQGLGFAIPSSTILREIGYLVTGGSYGRHPWLGISGVDMTYEIAEAMGANVTYGLLVVQVTSGGPADNADLRGGTQQVLVAGEYVTVGGDIIVALNGTRIIGMDALSSYLEEHTAPDQVVNLTIVRASQTTTILVTLGTRK